MPAPPPVTYRHRFAAATPSGAAADRVLQRPFHVSERTAGGIGICITDLLAYARFIWRRYERERRAGADAASLEQMRTAQLRKHSYDDDMGIGWICDPLGAFG